MCTETIVDCTCLTDHRAHAHLHEIKTPLTIREAEDASQKHMERLKASGESSPSTVEELVAGEFDGESSRPLDIQKIARQIQRTNRTLHDDVLATISGPQEEKLALAAVHLWRAKMHVRLSHLYTEKSWDSRKLPRKFFLKYRGFGPSHQRSDLVEFRKLYLRCALSNAERATDLAPFSFECVMLKSCILCLLVGLGGYMSDSCCEKALSTCRRAMTLHRMPEFPDDREMQILYSSKQHGKIEQITSSSRSDARMSSLWNMAIFAAHTVAKKRGGWDHDTLWADRQNTSVVSSGSQVTLVDKPMDELVEWNMWESNWLGVNDDSTLQDVLDNSL